MEDEIKATGFIKHNNYELVEYDDKKVVLKVKLTENTSNPYGMAHGGLIFGLGDTAMGMLFSKKEQNVVTVDSNINFLRPGVGEYLICESEMVKDGKQIALAKANIYNNDKKLVATMSANYYYIK